VAVAAKIAEDHAKNHRKNLGHRITNSLVSMFESITDPKGYKRFRKAYDAAQKTIFAETWENFQASNSQFFSYKGPFG
jgi:hypothetical protein